MERDFKENYYSGRKKKKKVWFSDWPPVLRLILAGVFQSCWWWKTESGHWTFYLSSFQERQLGSDLGVFVGGSYKIHFHFHFQSSGFSFFLMENLFSFLPEQFFYRKRWFSLNFLESTWAVLLYGPYAIENSLYPLHISLAPLRSKIWGE